VVRKDLYLALKDPASRAENVTDLLGSGAPLAVWLMSVFAKNGIPGVTPALLAMGVIYFIYMGAGAMGFRVAPSGWELAGWTPSTTDQSKTMITRNNVHLSTSWKTPQFWLIWGVLGLNVTAGIAV
jgi:hypothetical protein